MILLLYFVLEKRVQEKLARAQAAALLWPCRGLKEGQHRTAPPFTRMFGSHEAEDSQGRHTSRGEHTQGKKVLAKTLPPLLWPSKPEATLFATDRAQPRAPVLMTLLS